MEFTNLVDLVQVFANEYCFPGSLVLFNGNLPENIKSIFKFINSEIISIHTSPGEGVDIVVSENILPFENHSFDLIIGGDLTQRQFLKPNGKLLIEGSFYYLNYYLNESSFTVV